MSTPLPLLCHCLHFCKACIAAPVMVGRREYSLKHVRDINRQCIELWTRLATDTGEVASPTAVYLVYHHQILLACVLVFLLGRGVSWRRRPKLMRRPKAMLLSHLASASLVLLFYLSYDAKLMLLLSCSSSRRRGPELVLAPPAPTAERCLD